MTKDTGSSGFDDPSPITPVRAPEVRPHVQTLNALVMTLVRKESIGKRAGMQLLDQMHAMLRIYQRDNRRRAIFEELDRPHADAADLADAMHTINAVLTADPRVRTWQAIIDEYTTRFVHGPVRKEAERDTLTQAARALADAAIVQALLGDDLIPYLESQDIDPAPWLAEDEQGFTTDRAVLTPYGMVIVQHPGPASPS